MTTRKVLFIQGAGADTHDEWDDKLVASLERELGHPYDVRYPRLPDEDDPTYARWGPAIEIQLAGLDEGAVVVGHSVGGTILIDVLAQGSSDRALAAVILIAAPFVGGAGWPGEGFELPHDLGARLPRAMDVHIVHGEADETVPPSHADLYAKAIPHAHLHLLPGLDHQLGDDLRIVAELIRALDPRPG